MLECMHVCEGVFEYVRVRLGEFLCVCRFVCEGVCVYVIMCVSV